MTLSTGNSHPNLFQPSSSFPLLFELSGGKTPKEKIKVEIQFDESMVGEHSKVWSTRMGDFVRAHIPVS